MLSFFFKSAEPIRYTHKESYCKSRNLQSVSCRPREPRSWWYKLQPKFKSKARENQTPSSKVYSGLQWGFPGGSVGKESTCNAGNAGDEGSIPGSGRSPGGGHGNPLQYSCLEDPHGQRSLMGYSPGATKSWTRLSTGSRKSCLICSSNKHEHIQLY